MRDWDPESRSGRHDHSTCQARRNQETALAPRAEGSSSVPLGSERPWSGDLSGHRRGCHPSTLPSRAATAPRHAERPGRPPASRPFDLAFALLLPGTILSRYPATYCFPSFTSLFECPLSRTPPSDTLPHCIPFLCFALFPVTHYSQMCVRSPHHEGRHLFFALLATSRRKTDASQVLSAHWLRA